MPEPVEVGFCSPCEAYVTPYEAECPGDDTEDDQHDRPLRRELFYICETCWDRHGFLDVGEYEEHMKEWHESF